MKINRRKQSAGLIVCTGCAYLIGRLLLYDKHHGIYLVFSAVCIIALSWIGFRSYRNEDYANGALRRIDYGIGICGVLLFWLMYVREAIRILWPQYYYPSRVYWFLNVVFVLDALVGLNRFAAD